LELHNGRRVVNHRPDVLIDELLVPVKVGLVVLATQLADEALHAVARILIVGRLEVTQNRIFFLVRFSWKKKRQMRT
jgi:hypothetical protein